MKRTAIALAIAILAGCGGAGSSTEPQTSAPVAQVTPSTPAIVEQPKLAFMGDSLFRALAGYFDESINAGIGGNTPEQMAARFDADVLSASPDIVVIMGGTNGRRISDIAFILEMANKAKAAGAKVLIGIIPPVGTIDVIPYNNALVGAVGLDFPLVDFFTPLSMTDNSQNAALFSNDAHPNNEGYLVMEDTLQAALDQL